MSNQLTKTLETHLTICFCIITYFEYFWRSRSEGADMLSIPTRAVRLGRVVCSRILNTYISGVDSQNHNVHRLEEIISSIDWIYASLEWAVKQQREWDLLLSQKRETKNYFQWNQYLTRGTQFNIITDQPATIQSFKRFWVGSRISPTKNSYSLERRKAVYRCYWEKKRGVSMYLTRSVNNNKSRSPTDLMTKLFAALPTNLEDPTHRVHWGPCSEIHLLTRSVWLSLDFVFEYCSS